MLGVRAARSTLSLADRESQGERADGLDWIVACLPPMRPRGGMAFAEPQATWYEDLLEKMIAEESAQ